MVIEYLDRIGHTETSLRWIVRADGELAIAHVYEPGHVRYLEGLVEDIRPFVRLSPEHLVQILSVQETDGSTVIITEDDRGPSFVRAAATLQEPSERTAWATGEVAGMAEAIAEMALRKPDFVHGNAMPEWTLVDSSGRARLRPHLITRRPRSGTYTGRATHVRGLSWMSPEQICGRQLGPTTDVFSLASMLYTGIRMQRPFGARAETELDVMNAIRKCERPEPPDCAAELVDFLYRNLEEDPALRDPTPAVFADKLRAIVGSTPPEARAKVAAARVDNKPAPHESVGITGSRCAKQWTELSPTTHDGVRYCGDCKHEVVEVRTIKALVPLLDRACVAYRPD